MWTALILIIAVRFPSTPFRAQLSAEYLRERDSCLTSIVMLILVALCCTQHAHVGCHTRGPQATLCPPQGSAYGSVLISTFHHEWRSQASRFLMQHEALEKSMVFKVRPGFKPRPWLWLYDLRQVRLPSWRSGSSLVQIWFIIFTPQEVGVVRIRWGLEHKALRTLSSSE